jgi:hypothetical protein
MAHFAEIDQNNIVLRVLVVSDQHENNGQEFLAHELALGGIWIQTSYNATIRKNFAAIGYTYDLELDAFIAPKCHDGAILDEEKAQWNCIDEEHNEPKIS